MGVFAELELHGVVARGVRADESQGLVYLHLIALLHLQRSEVEVGRDVLSVAHHHDVGALYLRMLEDERHGAIEDSAGLTVLLATDVDTIIIILHVLEALDIVDSIVRGHQIRTCDRHGETALVALEGAGELLVGRILAIGRHGSAAGFARRGGCAFGLLLLGVAGGNLGFNDAVDFFVEAVALALLAGYAVAYLLLSLLERAHELLLLGLAKVEFLLFLHTLGEEGLHGLTCVLQFGTLDIQFLLLDHQFLALLLLKGGVLAQVAQAAHHLIERIGREKEHEAVLKGVLGRHQA